MTIPPPDQLLGKSIHLPSNIHSQYLKTTLFFWGFTITPYHFSFVQGFFRGGFFPRMEYLPSFSYSFTLKSIRLSLSRSDGRSNRTHIPKDPLASYSWGRLWPYGLVDMVDTIQLNFLEFPPRCPLMKAIDWQPVNSQGIQFKYRNKFNSIHDVEEMYSFHHP